MQTLFIIRHGETDFNKQGLIQGRGVNTSLNEEGRNQAQTFFQAYQNIKFAHVFASALLRSQQSVEPFKNLGYEIKISPALDEMSWGIYEGHRADKEMNHIYKELITQWTNGKLDQRMEGGESPLDLQKRQQDFIQYELSALEGNILICTHGRAMRSLLCTLIEEDLSGMDRFPHRNLTLYKLERQNGKYLITESNNADHLKLDLIK